MLSEEPDTPPGAAIEPSSSGSESTLHDAVLLTLCYREIFEFPLTRRELHRYLILAAADESALDRSLTELEGRHVTLLDNYVLPPGGESMLELREARRHASAHCWRWALRYARWLRWVPFVRMVGVTGSVACDARAQRVVVVPAQVLGQLAGLDQQRQRLVLQAMELPPVTRVPEGHDLLGELTHAPR